MSDLFSSAGVDAPPSAAAENAPLAERLRPASLAEVVGQDHLLGPEGAIRRMADNHRLGSMILWGPPGTGKTTIARLLADAAGYHFQQLSAVFSGVADLRKAFEAAEKRQRMGERTLLFVDEIHGFTPQAYIYGLEFSREETRQRQRENLVSAIARLESLSAVQTARDAANRRDDAVAAATTQAVSAAATQAQLSRLRQVQPNGRIALELDPGATTLATLPAVPLEAGDRIVVPTRPGFVTVAGAVVNSNAFLWKPGRTAGEYLRLAGADEAAEPANMFILHADGTVSHAGDKRGLFGGNKLESEVMQPGDALIVPNQLDFETWGRAFVRNLKDFATIFTGFGIGIAAIHSL